METNRALKRTLVVAALYGAITLVLVRNLLPVFGTHLYADLGDPLLNATVLGWNAHQAPLTAAWWNFPAFAPLSGVTAFTEHLLLTYPLASPIIWIGGNPILAYNTIFVLAWWLNALAGYALGLVLTKSRESAFVAGLAFAFAPFNSGHVSHLQLLLAFGMPITLAGLHRYVLEGRESGLPLLAAGWLVVALSNAYMLALFPLLVAAWMMWFVRWDNWRRAFRALAALAAVSLPLAPLLYGYAIRHAAYALTRSYEEVQLFSSDMANIVTFPRFEALGPRLLGATPGNESALFPGITIVALAVIAFRGARTSLRGIDADGPAIHRPGRSLLRRVAWAGLGTAILAAARLWTGPFLWRIGVVPLPPFEPSHLFLFAAGCFAVGAVCSQWMRRAWSTRNAVVFFGGAVLAYWLLALGPEPTILRYRALAYGPYRALMWLPFMGSIRVAARAWQPATVCLAALAAYGISALLQKHPSRRMPIVVVASLAIVAEGWWICPVVATPLTMATAVIPKDALVLDLPAERVDSNAAAQYRGVFGGYRTLNGYSGYLPGHFETLVRRVQERNRSLFDDYRILDDLYVIVRPERFDLHAMDIAWVSEERGAEHLMNTADLDLYRLPAYGEIRAPMPLPLPSRFHPAFRLH